MLAIHSKVLAKQIQLFQSTKQLSNLAPFTRILRGIKNLNLENFIFINFILSLMCIYLVFSANMLSLLKSLNKFC